MVQGGLSETTRRCDHPGCICYCDPTQRHGPHLYLTHQSEGKNRALYVPAEHTEEARRVHAAWKEFWDLRCAIAARNREQLRGRLQAKSPRPRGGELMVELRHHQRTVWEGWFPEEAEGWWEPRMKHTDQVLDDEELVEAVHEAHGRWRPDSRRRGHKQTSAEVTLRPAVLKHLRNWSFEETEREVRRVDTLQGWRRAQILARGHVDGEHKALGTQRQFGALPPCPRPW